MILESFDFGTAKTTQRSAAPSSVRDTGRSNIRIALDYLGVQTKERPAIEIAKEIWYYLKSPDMLIIWRADVKMHKFAIEAAAHYENRACA